MAMDFPDSPSVGDRYTVDNQTWEWTGTTWDSVTQTSQLTGGTAGYTALSNGASGLSYQPVSHNYIINGAFDIWQRGTSFASIPDETYTADRWLSRFPSGAQTVSREAFTPGEIETVGYGSAKYFLRNSAASQVVNDRCRIATRIEDVETLAGQTVTLSFYARGSVNMNLQFRDRQYYGVGGSADQGSGTQTIDITTSWARYSFTIFMKSTDGFTVGTGSFYEFQLSQNSSLSDYHFDLWGVQLEAGSVATPFKRNANSIQGELAACQRYYFEYDPTSTTGIGSGYSFSSTSFRGFFTCPVPMRTAPTFAEPTSSSIRIQLNGSVYTPSSFNSIEALPAQIAIIANTSGMPSNHAGVFTTPERVTFDAEL